MSCPRAPSLNSARNPACYQMGPQRASCSTGGASTPNRARGGAPGAGAQMRKTFEGNPAEDATRPSWHPALGSLPCRASNYVEPRIPGDEPGLCGYRACAYRQAWDSQAVRSRGSSQFISAWVDYLRASTPGCRTLWAFPSNRRGCKGLGQLDSLDSGPAGARGSCVSAVRPRQYHRAKHLVLARLIAADRNACPGPRSGGWS